MCSFSSSWLELDRVYASATGPRSGNLTVLVDRSRLPRQPGLSEARLAYFWCALHTGAPLKAVYRLRVVSSAPRPPVELDTAAGSMLQAALPINRSRVTVAQARESPGKQALVEFLGYQTQREVQYRLQRAVPRVATSSRGQTCSLLQSLGIFDRQALPPCLGGTYDDRRFDGFLRERLSVENAMSAAPWRANIIPSSSNGVECNWPTFVAAEEGRALKRTRQ